MIMTAMITEIVTITVTGTTTVDDITMIEETAVDDKQVANYSNRNNSVDFGHE